MALSYGFCLGEAGNQTDSQQFSMVFQQLAGDGIGSGFDLQLQGFSLRLGGGYAFLQGRWIRLDEPVLLAVQPAGYRGDRYDGVAIQADFQARQVRPALLTDIDLKQLRQNPALFRNEQKYCLLLYAIRVRRGSSILLEEDVQDLRDDPFFCGQVASLSAAAPDALRAFQFFQTGLDERIENLLAQGDQVLESGDKALLHLEQLMENIGGKPALGQLHTGRKAPQPAENWLLCQGGDVPSGYPALSALLSGKLPDIRCQDPRIQTYIYGGKREGA